MTEIAELEVREDLKPEQVEKVNRKESLEAERERVEEFIGLYKQHLIENADAIKEGQQSELAKLSRGLAVLHSKTTHETEKEAFKGKLTGLWNSLKEDTRSNETSLTSFVTRINSALLAFSNDFNLQEGLTKFVTEFGNDSVNSQSTVVAEKVEEKPVEKPQVVAPKVEVKTEVKVEKKVEEAPKVVVEEKKAEVISTPAVVAPVTVSEPAKTE